jgi:hypothetical protein
MAESLVKTHLAKDKTDRAKTDRARCEKYSALGNSEGFERLWALPQNTVAIDTQNNGQALVSPNRLPEWNCGNCVMPHRTVDHFQIS